MAMASIEVKLPSPAKDYVMDDTTEEIRKALLLYPSIANNTISHGRAAELLGMHKIKLIELYGKLGIPYLDMTDEEFEEEIQTVKRLAEPKAVYDELTGNAAYKEESKKIMNCTFLSVEEVGNMGSVDILRNVTGLQGCLIPKETS